MAPRKSESVPIQTEEDIVAVRRIVRQFTLDLKFSLIDQTKIVTAASELARNTLIHGGGGQLQIECLVNGVRNGIKLTFEDQGPGIANIEQAMVDGYTTKGGMGLGLSGSKRLMNEFEIESNVGKGTRVAVTKWK